MSDSPTHGDAKLDRTIRIRGAQMHNLRQVDLDLPQGKLVVITGPSGSGKSSLAIDTLFAEGQRQYLETQSIYVRQFLTQLERPDVERVEGLPPTLCIDQRGGPPNPRSTVATVTEIHDYLRVLMARVGRAHCWKCQGEIHQQTLEEIRDRLLKLPEGSKVMVMAPLVRGRKGAHQDALARVRKAGLVRVRIDGAVHDIDQAAVPNPSRQHTIEAVVDRIVIRDNVARRLFDSVQLAARYGEGRVVVTHLPGGARSADWIEEIYSTQYACAACGIDLEEIEPRTFSFNSPYGACTECDGLGEVETDTGEARCAACGGSRLRPEARHVRLAGVGIQAILESTIEEAIQFFSSLQWSPDEAPIAGPLADEILRRLRFLSEVSLGYLTLSRSADTLSGGERQRVRLATCIGSGLVGVGYILDEPSIGLHPRDNRRLIGSLRELQRMGNTVIVVEHDEEIMREADFLVDLGPGAGIHGGRIVARGSPAEVACQEDSPTGRFLAGLDRIEPPARRRSAPRARSLTLEGVATHNLVDIDVRIPLGVFVCVTGVSGSGKSSLITRTLTPALAERLGQSSGRQGTLRSLRGASQVMKLIEIDQRPPGRTSRSTPATYSGLLDEIRKIFAATREARLRGFKANRFAYNAKEGRCPVCEGHGQTRIEMGFLPDLWVPCELCRGRRYNQLTLQVRFRGHSIADVLDLSVDEACELFASFDSIERVLTRMSQLGLGYLKLGQSSQTLSGGEAQRIKLATELARAAADHTLYVLDEPTTGLHPTDIRRLLEVIEGLVDKGHSVIVVEHNLEVIQCADWIIDLGPEGGAGGGRVVAEGPPEEIVRAGGSHTGEALRDLWKRRAATGGAPLQAGRS